MATHELPRERDELEHLVGAARLGDRFAFDELVRRTHVDTYTLAYRLTADDVPVSRPRLSPDGTRVAWTSWRESAPEVFVTAVDGGTHRYTYREYGQRVRRLGAALRGLGVGIGDRPQIAQQMSFIPISG